MLRLVKRTTRGRDGLTLVETVVAVFLFAIGMLAVFGLTGAMVRMNAFSERLARATELAGNKIEELAASSYSSLSSGTNAVDFYLVTWTVTDVVSQDCKRVHVAVNWPGMDDNVQQTVLRNVLTE